MQCSEAGMYLIIVVVILTKLDTKRGNTNMLQLKLCENFDINIRIFPLNSYTVFIEATME